MFCTFTGNRHRDGHSLRGHRKKSVPTSNPKEKHKLESTLSQLTGQTIKRVAAKSSRAISKRADPCCHKPAMTAEFTLTTTYSTCWRAFLCCVFMFQSVCAANSKEKTKKLHATANVHRWETKTGQTELYMMKKLYFSSTLSFRYLLSVCVYVLLCVHCAPAPSMHPCGTMALRSESKLRRSGAGTAWDKRAALFHSFSPSIHFPLMSFD